jgi:hypothetical protein
VLAAVQERGERRLCVFAFQMPFGGGSTAPRYLRLNAVTQTPPIFALIHPDLLGFPWINLDSP